MKYDHEKVDQIVLALLTLTMFEDGTQIRAWKGHDWEVLNRLFEQGYIFDPKNKAKSVALSDEGAKRSKELFAQHFGNG